MSSKTGKVAVLTGPRQLEVWEYEVPEVGEDDVLLETALVGICGTDVHFWREPERLKDMTGAVPPVVIGHEITARVGKLGSKAACQMDCFDLEGNLVQLQEGDRVVVLGISPCGQCWGELALATSLPTCEKPLVNYTMWNPKEWPHFGACYGEYLYVRPRSWFWKIPDNMPWEVAVLADAAVVGMRAIEKALSSSAWMWGGGLPYGAVALVQGSGPIGILAAAMARIAGLRRIIMIGGPQTGLDLATEMGVVDHTINISESDVASRREEVLSLTPNRAGVDLVIGAAGVPAAVQEGLSLVRAFGVYVEVGSFTNVEQTTPINVARQVVLKNVTIHGVANPTAQSFMKVLKTLCQFQRQIPFEKVVTHVFPVNQAQEAFETADRIRGSKIAISGAGHA